MEPVLNKRDKHDIEIKSRFFRELEEIVELAPQYTIAHHLYTILFRNTNSRDPYFLTNEQILKRTELHRQSIEQDYSEETYDE